MTMREKALEMHKQNPGKIGTHSTITVESQEDLGLAYSPGVAEPCKDIEEDINTVYDYTSKGNLVAVVSNGSAVLGLGNIGPEASLPVMEGKALLFKEFAEIDAFPLSINNKEVDRFIETVKALEPTFGGINLEDIKAPDCFVIEDALREALNIPVFHDDQHGTAIVTLAGLINAMKLVDKTIQESKIVINGAGAAGVAVTKLLLSLGVKDVILCDSKGAIYEGRTERMNDIKQELSHVTNRHQEKGTLEDVMKESDVVIGVSAPDSITEEMIHSMNPDPIIFAMANPIPEIMPEKAKQAGVHVIGTGRSDFPNQVNNVLAFPGVFRGALDVRASEINEDMKIAAANAIANLIPEDDLEPDYVIPNPLDKRVVQAVSSAVAQAAKDSGAAKLHSTNEAVKAPNI
ncbi:malate dehydrogenase (oxaloacetate-decarboxylating) [Alteribacillus persepolensis]|uniref:Malate dehydrogenase (Oxaloacetate-decarboxylating) n=1 Tax=Alteribacillus persepolensis TaxID=568899 RepID=A0A1G8GC14_9BACI|nr:malic enzyme-like NAD(P)-binding protein [Alteribacillus persepolensis]SDH91893.1 malate dehydrogenase (oxaloacetate-decarboxylating) [Alteribacillus persepolensis]